MFEKAGGVNHGVGNRLSGKEKVKRQAEEPPWLFGQKDMQGGSTQTGKPRCGETRRRKRDFNLVETKKKKEP